MLCTCGCQPGKSEKHSSFVPSAVHDSTCQSVRSTCPTKLNSSAEMTGKFHNEALASAAGAEAYVNAEWHPEKVRARYDWIYQYDANSVGV